MKKYFLTGLAISLPAFVTLWVVFFIVNFLTGPFTGITQKILTLSGLLDADSLKTRYADVFSVIDKLFILVAIFGTILLIGAIAQHFIVSVVLKATDRCLQQIPFIRTIYSISQQVIKTFFSSKSSSFKQVVLVPFPYEGSFAIGFITQEFSQIPSMVTVYVPTSPNPTAGYLLTFDRSKITYVDMSVEDAFTYLLSCGVLLKKPTVYEISKTPV